MNEQALTPFRRAKLDAEIARARAGVEAATAHARETMSTAPKGDPDDSELKLYHKGGEAAFYFCVWFAMLAPIILFVVHWD
jgi:hypothetical protein